MPFEPHHVRVWPWGTAPKELRDLSTNGGDEDWVALIPPTLRHDYFPWMEEGTYFGPCCVDEYEHPELPGFKVRIGSHS